MVKWANYYVAVFSLIYDVKVGTTPEPSSEIKQIMQISQYSTLKFTILYKQRDKPVCALNREINLKLHEELDDRKPNKSKP